MNAKRVGEQLKALGFSIISTVEGDETEDGMVEITKAVHVQVPTFGCRMNVVREEGDSFRFYPMHKSVAAMLPDLRKALGVKS